MADTVAGGNACLPLVKQFIFQLNPYVFSHEASNGLFLSILSSTTLTALEAETLHSHSEAYWSPDV